MALCGEERRKTTSPQVSRRGIGKVVSSQVSQKYLPRLGPVPLQILSPKAVVIPVKLPALDRGLTEEVSKDPDPSDSIEEVAEKPSPAPASFPRRTTTTVSARPEPSSTANDQSGQSGQSGEGGDLDGTFGGGPLQYPSGFGSALSVDGSDSRKSSDIGVILNLLKIDSDSPSRRRSLPVREPLREPVRGPVPPGQVLPVPPGATTEP